MSDNLAMGKRVAIIIERADTALGGAERSAFELAGLSSSDFDAEILAAKGKDDAGKVHILCGDFRGRRVPRRIFRDALKQHLTKERYDVVHSFLPFEFADIYQPRGGSYTETILRNAASYQNRFIECYKKVTAFANIRRGMLLRTEKNLCQKPDGPIVAALSKYVAEQFKRHYGLGEKRIVIIPNGVKINRPVDEAAVKKLREQIFGQLEIRDRSKAVLFLFAANNFRLKGLGCLIRAMGEAVKRNSEKQICLIIVGNGAASKYRRIADKLNIEKRIAFLGNLPNIGEALGINDVAVLPTFYDPSSRFILEALAAGKPVITTRFNGASDLFTDGRHGKVIDRPENIASLTDAISYFTNADNIRRASDAIITDNLKDKISIDRVTKQLISLYESIQEYRRRK